MATIRGNRRNNRLRGTRRADVILGLDGNDGLLGIAGGDRLEGGRGRDTLDGGSGADRLIGGAADDVYVVENRGDRVVEQANQGTDTVRASISYTLPTAVEKLELSGNRALNGTGNDADNVLTGNNGTNILQGGGGIDGLIARGGNDQLDGGTGADILLGGAGNDTYIVDNQLDVVSEKAITSERQFLSLQTPAQLASLPDAGGVDLLQSSITYGLPNDFSQSGNVENLQLLGGSNIDGAGNSLNNQITGNSGNNLLAGGDGNDVLNGGAGNDTLNGGAGDDALDGSSGNDVLSGSDGNDVLRSGGGTDSIAGNAGLDGFFFGTGATFSAAELGFSLINDFTRGEDLIVLAKRTFGLSSNVSDSLTAPGDFAAVSSDSLAGSSSALIVFSTVSSALYYNPNRAAAGFGIPTSEAAFALVAGISNLSGLDILVV